MTLTPAYGRDYTNKADVLEAWKNGADFICNHPMLMGMYCSVRDVKILTTNYGPLTIRYNKLKDVVTLT